MRASTEQRHAIIAALGRIESRRRGIDLFTIDRMSASALIVALDEEERQIAWPQPEPDPPTVKTRRRPHRLIVAELAANPDDPRHGTMNGYTNGRCRCGRCRAAAAAYPRTGRR